MASTAFTTVASGLATSVRGFGTIVWREAVRQSRRWQTWVLRFGVAALLVVIVATVLRDPPDDAALLGYLGAELYSGYSSLMLGIVTLLAPVLVSFAIQEELDEGTFDLLTLSGLTASHVLWGKVGSRLLALLTVVAGGLPALALVGTLGGVAPWQVINGVLAEIAIAVTLGSIAGFFALFMRNGPVWPTLAALAWAVPAWGMLPLLRFEVTARGEDAIFQGIPFAGPWCDGPQGLLAPLSAVPVVVLVMGLALPVFRILLTDESTEEFGLLSPDIWVLERYRDRLIGAAIVLVLGTIGLVAVVVGTLRPGVGAPWAVGATWLWLVAAQCVLTPMMLLGAIGARKPLLAWREMLLGRRVVAPEDTRVWGDPVVWRELTGRPYAATRWLVAGAGALWLLEVVLFTWAESSDGLVRYLSAQAIGAAILAMPVVATLHQLEERRARTLPVLRTTTLTARHIVLGKLAVVWIRTLPWLVAGLVLWSIVPHETSEWGGSNHHAHGWAENLLPGWQSARIAAVAVWAWVAGTLLATTVIAVGLLVANARTGWVGAAAAVFVLTLGAPFGGAVVLDRLLGAGEDWLALWYPWVHEQPFSCDLGGVPVELLVSIGFLGALLGVAWRVAVDAVERFARDMD